MAELLSDDVDEIVILVSSTIILAAARIYLTKCSKEKAPFCLGSRLLAVLR